VAGDLHIPWPISAFLWQMWVFSFPNLTGGRPSQRLNHETRVPHSSESAVADEFEWGFRFSHYILENKRDKNPPKKLGASPCSGYGEQILG